MAIYYHGQVKQVIEDMERIGLYLHSDGSDSGIEDLHNGMIVFAPYMRTFEISFYTWGEVAQYYKERKND